MQSAIQESLSSRTCRVALVGAGYMSGEHAKAFASLSNAQLCGICSRTSARAEELARQFGITAVCGSVSELYEKTRADLVVVSVPELAMREISHECFKFPWTVLLEKPAGYTVEEAELICRDADRNGRRAFVALNRRFYSSTRIVKEDLELIHGSRFIHIQDQEDPVAAIQAGQPKAVVQNWMYANSIHIIDLLRFFGRGTITSVKNIFPWSDSAPDVVAASIEFSSGDRGIYQGIWRGPGPWAVQVTTPEKRWELRPLEKALFQIKGERKLNEVPVDPLDGHYKAGLRKQAEEAIRAALGLPTQLPTLADGLETMRLIHCIFNR